MVTLNFVSFTGFLVAFSFRLLSGLRLSTELEITILYCQPIEDVMSTDCASTCNISPEKTKGTSASRAKTAEDTQKHDFP